MTARVASGVMSSGVKPGVEANGAIVRDLRARTAGEPAGSTGEGTVLVRHESYNMEPRSDPTVG